MLCYMMTNPYRTTIYTGVTNVLIRRVAQHKEKSIPCFTRKYSLVFLVCYEVFTDIREAIGREKVIKGGSRRRKNVLIEAMNPAWKDLSGGL